MSWEDYKMFRDKDWILEGELTVAFPTALEITVYVGFSS